MAASRATKWAIVACTTGIACGESQVPGEMVREGETFDLIEAPPALPLENELRVSGLAGGDDPRLALRSEPLRHFGRPDQRLAGASREELAQAFRSVVMDRSGGLYVQRGPNWKAADALLGSDRATRVVDAREPSTTVDRIAQAFVIGDDGRTVPSVGVHPFSAIARLLVTHSDGSLTRCSGAYIGTWTLITAGHCLVAPSGAPARRILFQPQRAGSSAPFSFDCRNDDTSTSNDVAWAVPAGFLADPVGADSLEYGVIDTWPCHSAPSRFAGYAVWPNDATYSAYGYPSATCPGASAAGTFLCGMSGPAYDTDGWILETEHIDLTSGQSGGPWFRRVSGVNRVMAISWSERQYFDLWRCGFDLCRRNSARLIDDAVDAFIRANSFDY